ncbi:hypothetical protein KGY71_05080 [Candidatus Bipolaricaulota bacterium]|nr:hypothetical protein [Candidatus Bipolaricaulota bacterium]
MKAKAQLVLPILLLGFGLIFAASPATAEEVELPQDTTFGSLVLLMEEFASSNVSQMEKNNAISGLIRVSVRGLYELDVRGELDPEFVEEARTDLFSSLADYQTGAIDPDRLLNRVSSVFEEVETKTDVPIISVTKEMALGRAILEVPGLLGKPPEELDEVELSRLVGIVSRKFKEKRGDLEVTKPTRPEPGAGREEGGAEEGLLKMDRKSQVNRTIFGEEEEKK